MLAILGSECKSIPRIASMIEQLKIGQNALADIVENGEQQCFEVKNIILG